MPYFKYSADSIAEIPESITLTEGEKIEVDLFMTEFIRTKRLKAELEKALKKKLDTTCEIEMLKIGRYIGVDGDALLCKTEIFIY
ncbi:hypothetical protein ACQKQC_05925 [Vibrio fortis]|uniref:hypothetical protein n=1 Tax=Vibrio fortis TaxID=212667 RepID=UPI004067E9CF